MPSVLKLWCVLTETSLPYDNAPRTQGLARKLYKVFEYAHDNHTAEFKTFEDQYHLCARFHMFAEKYEYMDPADLDIQLN